MAHRRNRLPPNVQHEFAQPPIIHEYVQLTAESTRFDHFQDAFKVDRRCRWYIKGGGSLRTEAAVESSALGQADHVDSTTCRIVNAEDD